MNPTIAQPASTSRAVPRSYEANMFTLHGRHGSVRYSATSITGQPLLHYKDGHHEVNARGKDIRRVETEIGTLVSITLEPDEDGGELLFTLVVPRVTLTAVGGEQPIKTVGFFTRVSQVTGSPDSAQLQTYETVGLKGSATFVMS